ncbi:MAG: hypothetical protein AB7V42_15955 [Thermoleophilia bacterium]
MGGTVVLWAGKELDDEEAARVRRLAQLARRVGEEDTARGYERFLPESDHAWTPDELEAGAHAGPWLGVSAVTAVTDEPGDELT